MSEPTFPNKRERILELLAKEGPKTASEMVQILQLSKSSLYSGLTPLVNKQLVVRIPHAAHEIIQYGLNENPPPEKPVQPKKKPADTAPYCDAFWNAFLRKVDIPKPPSE